MKLTRDTPNIEPWELLLAGVIKQAVVDAKKGTTYYKKDAILFFEKNPYHLPEDFIEEIRRLAEI